MDTTYQALASKTAFNKALRHFFKVSELVDEVDSGKNLADLVNSELDEGEMQEDQILPAVGAIIRDKYNYSYDSSSIPSNRSDFNIIIEETAKWTALDLLIVYYDTNNNVVLVNPKNPDHWDRARELYHDQLVVIYSKYLKEENTKLEMESITTLQEMLAGKDVFINKEFVDATVMAKSPEVKTKTEAPVAAKNITPKYAVTVSNELFHNGNVEAWKKIIESYTTKFPNLKVHIFFEGEVINDINALFKWGKVKHGDSIFFQVSGDEIKGVSKLQKYLYEGASHRFEQFLKIGVGQVLNLF